MSAMAGDAYAHQAGRDILALWDDLHAAMANVPVEPPWPRKRNRLAEVFYHAKRCGILLKGSDE